jgi:hypothetical protein
VVAHVLAQMEVVEVVADIEEEILMEYEMI